MSTVPSVRTLFLVDGCGAVVTAMMLGVVIPRFESAFGMPTAVLHPLAAVAAAFAVYSFACRVLARTRAAALLLGIAGANTAYCAVTLALVIRLREPLTGLGTAYFVGEILVVMTLVLVEARAGLRDRAIARCTP